MHPRPAQSWEYLHKFPRRSLAHRQPVDCARLKFLQQLHLHLLTQPLSKWTFNMPETVVISRFQHWSPLWNPSYFPVCPSMSCYEMSSFMNLSLCLESSVVPSSSLPLTEKKIMTSSLKCLSMQLLLNMFNTDSEPVISYCFVLSSALFCHWRVIKHHLWKKERENCENFPESLVLVVIATFLLLCFMISIVWLMPN